MDGFASLFSAFGLASAAGFNAYVPLLTVGLVARYTDLLRLAEPFDVLTQPWVLAVIGALAVVDFVADKVPAVDTAWHGLGALVSPIAGAVLFASQQNVLSDMHPAIGALAGLIVAGGFHGSRAAVRPVSTAATGGLGNPVLSLLEDLLSGLLSLLAVFLPVIAFGLAGLVAVIVVLMLMRAARVWRERKATRLRPG
ncbi:DUF4126 domain-containing protein [Phenylobacterium sp.]|uniref:DUF4126 domain-containing protein n=1 Tax=Phenylobacterium sp. TaxID=1871053 RepID=UPI00272FD859|nr:DUF4126 domain-containing protein [Phenylobacterium sp.]MDP1617982.1 DUF4126 domain-containing protein [Phenylobacterium sp.]MDP1986837.1 DUF4126 domain-containing protein [Phenylobacterium sp.]